MIPELVGGCFNGEALNEWNFNGGGNNPIPVHSFEVDFYVNTYPLILTEEMLAVFDECPDLIVPCEDVTTLVPAEDDLLVVAYGWPVLVVPREDDRVLLPAEVETMVVPSDWPELVIPPNTGVVTP
jgi:hypothetical protein